MTPTSRQKKCPECNGFGYYRIQFGKLTVPGKQCPCCSTVWTFTHEVHKRWYMWDCVASSEEELYQKLAVLDGCDKDAADAAGLVPIKTTFKTLSVAMKVLRLAEVHA